MIDDAERARADRRMAARLRRTPKALAAYYEPAGSRIVVSLDTGIDLVVPARLIQGLSEANAADLGEIEITPTGLGLHWPRLDADVYVPSLLEGRVGSRSWMTRAAAGATSAGLAATKAARSKPSKASRAQAKI